MMLYYSISRFEGRWLAMRTSPTMFELRPLITGFLPRVQSSTRHSFPRQNRQISLFFGVKPVCLMPDSGLFLWKGDEYEECLLRKAFLGDFKEASMGSGCMKYGDLIDETSLVIGGALI